MINLLKINCGLLPKRATPSLNHLSPISRQPHLTAMALDLQKVNSSYISFLISPSFICHPHHLPTFSPVPNVADNLGKTIYMGHTYLLCWYFLIAWSQNGHKTGTMNSLCLNNREMESKLSSDKSVIIQSCLSNMPFCDFKLYQISSIFKSQYFSMKSMDYINWKWLLFFNRNSLKMCQLNIIPGNVPLSNAIW